MSEARIVFGVIGGMLMLVFVFVAAFGWLARGDGDAEEKANHACGPRGARTIEYRPKGTASYYLVRCMDGTAKVVPA